jgi:gas vesicle protein
MSRFLLGFLIGVAIGVAVVIIGAPRSGSATRQGIRDLIDETIAAGKRASKSHEQKMWSEFHAGLAQQGK